MKSEIVTISILEGSCPRVFSVGIDGVGSIVDRSVEFENSIDFIYSVLDEWENPIHQIENCPVVLDFKKLLK